MTTDHQTLLTLSEVAELAGVGPSAVSNWRNRWSDFPLATNGRYLQGDVVAWLQVHDKDVRPQKRPAPSALLWKAADTLRSTMTAEDTLELILQLLILRAAKDPSAGRLDPAGEWWDRVSPAAGAGGGSDLAHAAAEIGRIDRELGEVLEPSSSVRRLSASDLWPLIHALGDFDAGSEWMAIATEILTDFPERFGLRAGEQATPSALAELITHLLQPIRGHVYDPACGVGVLLARAWTDSEHRDDVALYGQDLNPQAHRLARLHLLLSGARFQVVLGDTLLDDRLWDIRVDRVAAQPPLNQRMLFTGSFRHDPRWQWGVPTSSLDWLWVQQVAFHLTAGGIGVVVVASGSLFRGGAETAIRRHLLDTELLDAVIQLPPAMIPSTAASLSLLVLQRGRSGREGTVLFVDASKAGSRRRGGLRRFQDEEIDAILAPIRAWRSGVDPTHPGVARVATVAELLENGAVLSPTRYVAYPAEREGEQIAARYRRLSASVEQRLDALPTLAEALHGELSDIEVVE